MNNKPINLWPDAAFALHADLRWLVEHQAEIVRAWGARSMPVVRPVKAWPDGKVRIEFVQTWKTCAEARAECEAKLPNTTQGDSHAD